MKSNLTPHALDDMTIDDIAKLDIADLARLHDEIKATEKEWIERKNKMNDALELRFAARAVALLAADGAKIAGSTTFPEDGMDVKRITSQEVKWDQETLAAIWARIVAAKENPAVYMTQEFKVAEAAYKTWTANIRAEFDKGRAVKPKRATYEFKPRKT